MLLLEDRESLTDEALELSIDAHEEPLVLFIDRVDSVVNITGNPRHPPPATGRRSWITEVIEMDDGYCAMIDVLRLIEDILSTERTDP
jgi:chemotaxis signal transduction protein